MQYQSTHDHIYLINPPFNRKDYIKETLGGVWSDRGKKGKGWKFPKNVFVYRELYKAFPELRDDKQFVNDGIVAKADVDYWMNQKDPTHLPTFDKQLRPYQNHDAYYLAKRGSALVLNEPRTGKTPTMISVIKAFNNRSNIVICPSSLVLNWTKEFKKWFPECAVYPVVGTPRKREIIYDIVKHARQVSVMIISKDTWKIDKDVFENFKFDVAVVDEAHFLRNWKSAQSQAIFKLQANTKYALTGTPSVKHGSDVYGLLHFINPDKFSSYWQFTARYWEIDDNGWGKDIGVSKRYREEELRTVLALNSVQRKRKDVMKWLPSATLQTIPVEMNKKQFKLYEQMFETFVASVGEGEELHEVDTMNVLTQLMRLRQLCVDPRLLGFDVVGTKTEALLDFADGMTEPFVVMTTFSSYFKIVKPELQELGKRVEVIDGSVSKTNRQKIVERFQRGEIDVLLCNIIAAGTGLTLDRADTIVFIDKAFNPSDNEQAQDRIVPTTIDKLHPINVITLVVEGSIDERVNDILDRKENLTKIINKPELLGVKT